MAYGYSAALWCAVLRLPVTFLCSARLGERVLQNFLLHIRKLPHFDTRLGVAQARCGSPQKRAFCVFPGRRVGAFLSCVLQCKVWQFLGSKRVSKWGNFLISLISFCKSRAVFRKIRCCANGARLRPPKYNLCARASALEQKCFQGVVNWLLSYAFHQIIRCFLSDNHLTNF